MPLPVENARTPGVPSSTLPSEAAWARARSLPCSTESACGDSSAAVASGVAVVWIGGSSTTDSSRATSTVTSRSATVTRTTRGRNPMARYETPYTPSGTSRSR